MSTVDAHRQPLDPRERTFLVDSGHGDLQLFLRHLPASVQPGRGPVLYLHGATFPSALSVAYRFGDSSWRDALCHAGFDVWALDFLGFGGSDRYREMAQDAGEGGPLGLAAAAVGQVGAAHPTLVDRIFMFAPPACRMGPRCTPRPTLPAWKPVTIEDQWERFVEDVPPGEPPILSREDFTAWAEAYLASDPEARTHHPPAIRTPTGPLVEILRAWHSELAWEPAEVEAPVAICRGAWDGLVTDDDARWLFGRLSRSSERRDVKIGRGTHLMHLEAMRGALWRGSVAFLTGGEAAPVRP